MLNSECTKWTTFRRRKHLLKHRHTPPTSHSVRVYIYINILPKGKSPRLDFCLLQKCATTHQHHLPPGVQTTRLCVTFNFVQCQHSAKILTEENSAGRRQQPAIFAVAHDAIQSQVFSAVVCLLHPAAIFTGFPLCQNTVVSHGANVAKSQSGADQQTLGFG